MNADWLIDLIVSEDQRDSRSSAQQPYSDEPIRPPAAKQDSALPQPLMEARRFARESDPWRTSGNAIFAAQARMLADYEDDTVFTGTFQRYFPTYESMSDAQLRGYFGFRTRLRQGDTPNAPVSFVYVHVYELLHLIGAKDADDAFRQLQALLSAY
ncbi:MAG: TerB N-terminal domain-containing protein, partial [Clostridia bacterium]|nr:TerB N-terminal domain-containing protein [Clostridia bacterium]